MSLAGRLNKPFTRSTAAISSEVPHPYDMAINGLAFFIDEQHIAENFRKESIPLNAAQADTGEEPGERSISRKELWRRSASTWHKGAGQTYFDKGESDRARFRSSRGVDVWTKWQLSLLPDVESVLASAATNLAVLAVGSRFYVADATVLKHTASLDGVITWTDALIQAGEAAASVQSITTDGFNVYAALGANGVHRSDRGAAVSAHFNDLQAQLVAYLKGRLMAARDNAIFNITASGAAPAALFTHPNADFRWAGFAEGRNAIYAAGFSGDKSLIYRTAIQPDGTALTIPVVAGELPDGEVVRSVQGYLGNFIIIGTDLGLRFAQVANDEGDLLIGGLVRTPGPVRCFEPQDRYVWFGWERYDSTHTGLGRLDLQTLNDLVPAYASDLMVEGSQANVLSIATFANKRVFAVSGLGIYRESTNKVASGIIDGGYLTFDLADPKTLANIIVRHSAEDSSFSVYLAMDPLGTFIAAGSHRAPAVGVEDFPLNQATAERFEIRLELVRNTADATEGPLIRGWTLRARPAPGRNLLISVPVKMFERVQGPDGGDFSMNVAEREQALESLLQRQLIVPLQLGSATYTVFLDDYQWLAEHRLADRSGWNGTAVLTMMTLN